MLDACVPLALTLPAQKNGLYVVVNTALPPIVHVCPTISPACDILAFTVTPFFTWIPPEPVVYIPVPPIVPLDTKLPDPLIYNKLLLDELLTTKALFVSLSFFIVTALLNELLIAVAVCVFV